MTVKKSASKSPSKSPKKSKSLEPEIIPQSDDFILGLHPRLNSHLFGHRHAAQKMVDSFASGRVPQAVLLTGMQGIGKATFVYHIIRAMERAKHIKNITIDDIYHQEHDSIYRRIATMGTGNLRILRREYNDKTSKFYSTIRMEDVRELKSFFNFAAHNDGYRYCVVDCVDDMVQGKNAVPNAILKTLEEPPAKTIFFLIAHHAGNVLPTIKSRCTVLNMSPPDDADMHNILGNIESFKHLNTDQKIKIITESNGSVRRALIYADKVWIDLLKGIKNCLLKSIPVEQAVNMRATKEKFYDGTATIVFIQIMHTIFLSAVTAFIRYSVKNTPTSLDIFLQTDLHDKLNQLFLTAEDYNFTPSETFDSAVHLLTYYHYKRSLHERR
jgi:DNA polymerase III subunit delta'